MYIVTVEFIAKPEHADEFRVSMIANARASRETEPGCRQFDVVANPEQPATIFLYEVYDDRAAFDAHLATPHYTTFNTVTAPWLDSKTVHHYQRLDP